MARSVSRRIHFNPSGTFVRTPDYRVAGQECPKSRQPLSITVNTPGLIRNGPDVNDVDGQCLRAVDPYDWRPDTSSWMMLRPAWNGGPARLDVLTRPRQFGLGYVCLCHFCSAPEG